MFATADDVKRSYGRPFLLKHADPNGDGEPDLDVICHELEVADEMVVALLREAPPLTSLTEGQLYERLRDCTVHVAAHRLAFRAGKDPAAALDAYMQTITWLRALRAGNLPGQTRDRQYVADEEPERDVRVSADQVVSGRDPNEGRGRDPFHSEPDIEG